VAAEKRCHFSFLLKGFFFFSDHPRLNFAEIFFFWFEMHLEETKLALLQRQKRSFCEAIRVIAAAATSTAAAATS